MLKIKYRPVSTFFDRFDVCEAYMLFAQHYHGGMYSEEYKILGRLDNLEFSSPYLTLDTMGQNAQRIYANLKYNHIKMQKEK